MTTQQNGQQTDVTPNNGEPNTPPAANPAEPNNPNNGNPDNGGADNGADKGNSGADKGDKGDKGGDGTDKGNKNGSEPGKDNGKEPNKQDPAKQEPIEYNLNVPEGLKAVESEVAKFKELAKGMNLSNEQAQKMFDFIGSQIKFSGDKALQEFKTCQELWTKQTKEQFTEEQIGNAAFVAKKVGGDNFVKLLDDLGISNNPLLIGFLSEVSRHYMNDKTITGKPSAGEVTEQEKLNILYPSMAKK